MTHCDPACPRVTRVTPCDLSRQVVLIRGHYLSYLPLCSRNEPVFVATCTPIAMPETRECVVQGATNVFTSVHSMDMKFMQLDEK